MFDEWADELRGQHPEIARLAPRAELRLSWSSPEVVGKTVRRVQEFPRANTPS